MPQDGDKLGFLQCGWHVVLSWGEVRSCKAPEAMVRGLILSWGRQGVTGSRLRAVGFSLWTAPCAPVTVVALSLQSVLGEWEVWAGAVCSLGTGEGGAS